MDKLSKIPFALKLIDDQCKEPLAISFEAIDKKINI